MIEDRKEPLQSDDWISFQWAFYITKLTPSQEMRILTDTSEEFLKAYK